MYYVIMICIPTKYTISKYINYSKHTVVLESRIVLRYIFFANPNDP